jgi:hypothetical protein
MVRRLGTQSLLWLQVNFFFNAKVPVHFNALGSTDTNTRTVLWSVDTNFSKSRKGAIAAKKRK